MRFYVLAQAEVEVEAASVEEALIKGQAAHDRFMLDSKTPYHERLKWMAWAVPEAEAK